MALALWREAPLEEVLRVVCEGLSWLDGGEGAGVRASKSAISQARTRLGALAMQQLAERVLQPIAAEATPGAWYRHWRLMALDGSTMDVADEQANVAFFGYPGASRGQSAFPQTRLLALVECGTHAITAATLGPFRESEQAMAARLLPEKLRPDMLVLADRNFYSFKLWQKADATGAKLLWRIKSNLKLPVEERLPDGSYLSTLYSSQDRKREHGQTVRVIDYELEGLAHPAPGNYRLLTNVLDPKQADALELAALYHERWGLLLAHFAIRQLMAKAAGQAHLDPDRLSFMHAVRVVKRKLPQAATIPP